ncbi:MULTISPECIES: hypothetical protein [unclassified Corallococcus]|uniref:hypothetical protein n=1 Tax=unclassified Corallococcus TaxID=2685029 RepID=UPI001A8E0793|nr:MULTISPECIES: hypothetical protein [unclassified Corallococcus]MBN9687134.1 hypothetical protein [Corallococcus sp. NCSPR001]WAS89039.1 hypothetical protein O0N60_19150 [Corallococcus sp. NCRR]
MTNHPGRMTVTDYEGREVGALEPVAPWLDGLLYDSGIPQERVQEAVGRLHLGWFGWDSDGRDAESAR